MKIILSFPDVYLPFFRGYSQTDYPELVKHLPIILYSNSDNHNIYVYDANIKAGIIDSSQPISEYRIVYTKNGIKKILI
jgi:hypothetical protein